jgi:cholesterol oxidase
MLSRDVAELDRARELDVVVIGSGYGAGVMAARLSAHRTNGAAPKIAMLERGREFAPDDFPASGWSTWRETQIWRDDGRTGNPLGLFDVRIDPDVTTLVGCGLGGTSLINGNVSIKPHARVFDPAHWGSLTLQGLEPYYERARKVLGPEPTPTIFPKARLLEKCAQASDVGAAFRLADINVDFSECKACGNCVTGCRFGAKKTLTRTYLPIAVANGVAIYTHCEVMWIEQRRDRYAVHYRRTDKPSSPVRHVLARTVVLGAGTLGSTEILARSAERGLPVSTSVGHRFSCNGDLMALGYDFPDEVDSVGFVGSRVRSTPKAGPSITGIVDLRSPTGPLEESMIIEEGSFPGGLAALLRYVVEVIKLDSGKPVPHLRWKLWLEARFRELLDLLGIDTVDGALNHSQVYFAIGHDGAAGRVKLDPVTDRARVHWTDIGSQEVYKVADRWLTRLTRSAKGEPVSYPFYKSHGHSNMLTAHPLGGCPIGRVVNEHGQVLDGAGGIHERLYVADGSIVPTSLGVNPLWTISALAEWIAEQAIRRGP